MSELLEVTTTLSEGPVLENRALAAETFLMTIHSPEAARTARPGSFVKIRAWAGPGEDGGGPLLDRPFSVHRTEGDRLSILYRVVGPATRLLSLARPGQAVRVTGPLGRGLDQAAPGPRAIYLVAGGIGLAPMALTRDWLGPEVSAVLFYGERSGALQVEENWLKSWAGDFTATVDDGTGYGRAGLVTEALAEALGRELRPIFACGPKPMLAAVSALGARFGAPGVWVSVEASMACGLGVCLTCSLPLLGGGRFRACQEGPVVDGLKVDWEKIR